MCRKVSGPAPYHGSVECLHRIVKEEGFLRLFVGLRPKCVYTALTNFVFFYLLRALRPFLGRSPLLQGMCAGVGVQLTVLPIDMVVVRLQSAYGSVAGFNQVLTDIVKEKGFFGLWSGLGPGLSLTLNPGINQGVLSVLLQGKRASSAAVAFWSAALAKAIASVITYPLMRAKVQMQVQRVERRGNTFRDTVQILVDMVSDNGVLAVFDGLGPQLVNAVLKEAILQSVQTKILSIVERMLSLLRRP